jgi:hypothetical protein
VLYSCSLQHDILPFCTLQDARYKGIDIPTTESLEDTAVRCMQYWEEEVLPDIRAGKQVLLCYYLQRSVCVATKRNAVYASSLLSSFNVLQRVRVRLLLERAQHNHGALIAYSAAELQTSVVLCYLSSNY